ncbi:phage tail protein [Brevibacillus brevis]|uniref:Phage tail protein n=2 Tax=Brevibacillus brevis TaxID=1393 RepID=A0A517I2F8_BREBE|nr:phage tail protein [Brevibacillus brevis]
MDTMNRFFSLNNPSDWQRGAWYNLYVSNEGIALNKSPEYVIDHVHQAGTTHHSRLLDFAIARVGSLLWLDESGHITHYDDSNNFKETVFRAGRGLFSKDSFLVADDEYVYIIDPEARRKVGAYSIANGQCVWSWEDGEGQRLFPLDAGLDEEGSLYITTPVVVDRDNERKEIAAGTQVVVLRLNRAGKIDATYAHAELKVTETATLREIRRRRLFRLSIAESGIAYLFLAKTNQVFRFSSEGSDVCTLAIPSGTKPAGFAVGPGPILYVGDSRSIDSAHDHTRFILRFLPTGEALAPLTNYHGRADKLVFDNQQRLYVWDAQKNVLTMLRLVSRTSNLDATGMPMGIYFSRALDSAEFETVWHKFTVDADIPEETQLLISTFSSDRKEHVIHGAVHNLDDFLLAPAMDWKTKLQRTANLWSEPVINASDALFHSAKGRYLWLKIEWLGTDRHSPLLRQMRIYSPRDTFLRYLPAVYQSEPASADFLERFLSLFGTFYWELEEQIDTISRMFDPDTTPGEFVPWLASWLGMGKEEHWTEAQRRELIRRAPELYAERGTRTGLEKMVELYTGERPMIVEYFQIRDMKAIPELHELISSLYMDHPYQFCLIVSQECAKTEREQSVLQKILEDQKPAFTEAKLIVLRPGIYADLHSYVGINSYLTEPSFLTLDQNLSMPYNTVLSGKDRSRRIDYDTRIGLDAELE